MAEATERATINVLGEGPRCPACGASTELLRVGEGDGGFGRWVWACEECLWTEGGEGAGGG